MTKLVVLTTSFPLHPKDYSGLFVLQYLKQLDQKSLVIAPHLKGYPKEETWGKIKIKRIRYAPKNLEKLFYHNGVKDNIKNNPALSVLAIPWMLHSTLKAMKELKKEDTLITNWAFPTGILGACLHKIYQGKVKHVNIIHSAGITLLKNYKLKALAKFLYKHSDKLHFVNQEHTQWFEELISKSLLPEKYILKPMPVCMPVSLPEAPKAPLKETKKHILYLGRLVKIKGLERMLDELNQEKNLKVAGSGYLQQPLMQAFPKVEFTGFVSGKKKETLLQESNIMVIPSLSSGGQIEGFPTVLLEGALHKNLLVISKEVKGIHYIFKDKENCLFYDPYKKGELKQLIETLNEKKMEEMIELSYNKTRNLLENYSLDLL